MAGEEEVVAVGGWNLCLGALDVGWVLLVSCE